MIWAEGRERLLGLEGLVLRDPGVLDLRFVGTIVAKPIKSMSTGIAFEV